MNTQSFHVSDYIRILKRRKWMVISFLFITVTSVTVVSFMQQKIYRATATVIVDAESPDILSVKDVVKLGEANYFAYRDYLETQQEIIRSKRTAHYVIKNLNLIRKEEFRKSKDPIKTLLEKLRVELIRDTRIIAIHVEDKDPNQARVIANEFAGVYANSNIALRTRMSRQAENWLKEEVDEQKRKVNEAELRLQEYKESNNIVSIENQKNMINDMISKFSTGYIDAQKKRIHAETTYNAFIDDSGSINMKKISALSSQNKSLQQLKDEYLKQEALMVEYRRIYKHKHPKMIKLVENINYIKDRMKDEIITDYRNLLKEENEFKAALETQKKRALDLERIIIKYNALKRELDTNERMLQIVLNRLKETAISGQIQTNNVRVQDLADTPKNPVKPKKKLNVIMSFMVGLAGGIGLAFFKEYMDNTVRDPGEIASLLHIPVLGSVPKVKRDGKLIRKKEDIDRVVEKDSNSLASEAYRSIRTNLLHSINHSSSSKTVVITSSIPKEGKTLTSVNLAMMIANSGERVLLVDADMRKPRIHTIFKDDNKWGLSDVLTKNKDFDDVVKETELDNFKIMTAGKPTGKSAELLSSQEMKNFLDTAKTRFSKIIFDTPPVSLVTDAAILSTLCNGAILITEGGKTTKELLARSKELLQKVDVNILGVIVNNISLTRDAHSYPHYYYGKYYKSKGK